MPGLFYTPPKLIHKLVPHSIWKITPSDKAVYLSFDDGPIPEVTEFVLDQLAEYAAKATFFCVGENVIRNPEIFSRIQREGHSLGNHTHRHLNCFKVANSAYLADIDEAAAVIPSRLFRPPYGKISPQIAKILYKKGYQIVMWSSICGDFRADYSKEKVLSNAIKAIQPGNILVLHDNIKSFSHLKYVLPRLLEYIYHKNLICAAVPQPR